MDEYKNKLMWFSIGVFVYSTATIIFSCTEVDIVPASSLREYDADTDTESQEEKDTNSETAEQIENDTNSDTRSEIDDATEMDTDSGTDTISSDEDTSTENDTASEKDTEYHFFDGDVETCSQLVDFLSDCMPEVINYINESCTQSSVTAQIMTIANCANKLGHCEGMTECIVSDY